MGVISVHTSLDDSTTFSSDEVVDDVLGVRLPWQDIWGEAGDSSAHLPNRLPSWYFRMALR